MMQTLTEAARRLLFGPVLTVPRWLLGVRWFRNGTCALVALVFVTEVWGIPHLLWEYRHDGRGRRYASRGTYLGPTGLVELAGTCRGCSVIRWQKLDGHVHEHLFQLAASCWTTDVDSE